jgi:hypothetical protein
MNGKDEKEYRDYVWLTKTLNKHPVQCYPAAGYRSSDQLGEVK